MLAAKKHVFNPRPKRQTPISEFAIFSKTIFEKIQLIAYAKTTNQKRLQVTSMIDKVKVMKNYNQSDNSFKKVDHFASYDRQSGRSK